MSEAPYQGNRLKRWFKILFRVASIGAVTLLVCFLVAAFTVMFILNRGLPSLDSLQDYRPLEVSQVYSEHGQVIGEFFEERRFVAKEIPAMIKQAFVAAEDSGFYHHKGIDFVGIVRAAYVNMMSGSIRQGASTITQQVARAFLLSPEKTYTRKLREIILAWQIESNLTKEQILNLYLNHIYLGSGAYGVRAAARVYFGKELEEVNLAEAAILAGLPQAPGRYSPSKNPDRVKRRQLYVLKQMLKERMISPKEYEDATKADVYVERRTKLNREIAPYFVEYVRQYVMNKYGSQRVLHDGLKIFTTLDVDMDRYATAALRKGLSDLEKRQGYRGPLKKLKSEDIKEYFRGRDFEERDLAGETGNQALEVSVQEAQGLGAIRMRPPKPLEVGDWLEGVVTKVDDAKQEALVEYEPEYFARIHLDDMRWAMKRVPAEEEGEDDKLLAVHKVSDVVEVGDVIPMSVKALPDDKSKPIDAFLEQQTEVEGALMAMDPRSGFVKALIGGYDFERSQFNRAIQAKRQPGSAFKPIIYAAALDYGFTPASIIQDSPIVFENKADEEKWRPSNYDHRFVGDVTLRNSLLASRNITTIKLLNEIGLDTTIEYAKRLGIESPLSRDFTLALGTSITTLQEIMQPYVVFVNGGYRRRPIFIKRIVDRDGNILEENLSEDYSRPFPETVKAAVADLKSQLSSDIFSDVKETKRDETASFLQDVNVDRKKRSVVTSPLHPGQVLSTETSFLMSYLLKENVLYGTGRRARELNRPASGKTGTTDDNKDAWFIGFTPQLVAGVWVGYDDLRVLGRSETGSSAAVPIWLDFMARASEPYPKADFPIPGRIEFARIDPKTGGLAGPKTRGGIFEAFVKGTAPTKELKARVNEMDLYQREP